MTHDEWMTLAAQPLGAVAGVAALAITAVGTGLIARLKTWLEAKAGAEVSKQVTDAATRVQAAMANEAGNIALEIQAGHLDVTDLAAVKARAAQGEAAIIAKLPQAVDLLKPVENAIAQGIAGKVLQVAPSVAAAAMPALLDAVNGVRVELQAQGRTAA